MQFIFQVTRNRKVTITDIHLATLDGTPGKNLHPDQTISTNQVPGDSVT